MSEPFEEKFLGPMFPILFDPTNEQGQKARKSSCRCYGVHALFFKNGGQVGVYDATNSTKKRRGWVKQKLKNMVSMSHLESSAQMMNW